MVRLTYRIETPGSIEAMAARIASDQWAGTFVALPGGSGVKAVRQAAVAGMPLSVYAENHPELAQSIAKFAGGKAA